MNNYIVYEGDRILYTCCVNTQTAQAIAEGDVRLILGEVSDIDAYYIQSGAPALRPPCPANLVGTTLTDLPVPSMIIINGKAYACEDATAQINLDQPGQYRVSVKAWPYLDGEFEIDHQPQ